MRRLAPVALGLLLAIAPVQPVMAAEKDPPKPQTMSLEAVALPIIVDGQLINYVFCSITLVLAPNADGSKVRAKEQYFRDDLVRTGHRTPFTLPNTYAKVDEAKVRAEILRFAPSVVGPGVVQSANITKQSSQKMLTLPPVPQSHPHDLIP